MSPLPQDLLSQNLRGGSGYGLVSSKPSDDSQDANAVHWVPFPLHSEYLLCKVLRSPVHRWRMAILQESLRVPAGAIVESHCQVQRKLHSPRFWCLFPSSEGAISLSLAKGKWLSLASLRTPKCMLASCFPQQLLSAAPLLYTSVRSFSFFL